MRIAIRTGERIHAPRGAVLPGHVPVKVPTVEIWIDGICFRTDVDSSGSAMALAARVAKALGIDVDQ